MHPSKIQYKIMEKLAFGMSLMIAMVFDWCDANSWSYSLYSNLTEYEMLK